MKDEPSAPGWLEEYVGCGCRAIAAAKEDLLGYCRFHGCERERLEKLVQTARIGHELDPRCNQVQHEPKDGYFSNYPTVRICKHCKVLYDSAE